MKHSYRPLPSFLTISDSEIDGLGLFTKKDIVSYYSLGISHIENREFPNGLIRTPLGGFINHSDKGNVNMVKLGTKYIFVTNKDIKAGQELTINYHTRSCMNSNCSSITKQTTIDFENKNTQIT